MAVEPLIDKLRKRVRRIDAEVLQAVRQQVCEAMCEALRLIVHLFTVLS